VAVRGGGQVGGYFFLKETPLKVNVIVSVWIKTKKMHVCRLTKKIGNPTLHRSKLLNHPFVEMFCFFDLLFVDR